jgi:hypothetical protein
MPYERVWWPEGRPNAATTDRYELELTRGRALAWKPKHGDGMFSSPVLADRLVVQFLDLADKVTAERNRKR